MAAKRIAFYVSIALALLLAACSRASPTLSTSELNPPDDQGRLAAAGSRPAPTHVPLATPAAPPTAASYRSPVPPPRVLTICLGSEPDTLYLYRASTYAARVIQEAVYDGPIDVRGYDLQPVILHKLPSLADGDAVLEGVTVEVGDRIVDDTGKAVTLAAGVTVRPAGCREAACAVSYAGQPLEMDQLSATFRLLPGLTWSDGTLLTAADSVFSFQAAQRAASMGEARGQPGLVPERTVDPVPLTASYVALDERTVRWVGLPGFIDPNYRANFFSPLPRHRLADLSADRWPYADDSARLPLGWGPYVLTDWEPGEGIVVTRNPHYFRAGEGLPYFDRVEFRFVGQDTAQNVIDLQTGDCDVLAQDALAGADVRRLLALQADGDVRLYAGNASTWEHLDFGIEPAADYQRPDYFGDVRVRQGMAYCIDRQRLADEVYGGLASVLPAYALPGQPLYTGTEVQQYEYDPSKGATLLNQAGWRDTDGDGVREAHQVTGIPDGTPLHVRYQAPSSSVRDELVGRVAADLAACGVGVTVSLPTPPVFFATGEDGLLYGRHFDLVELAWIASATPACDLFLSTRIPAAANDWAATNVTGYANPAYDAACGAALAALPGTPEYLTAHRQALRVFAQDLPVLPLLMRYQLSAARPDLAGYQPDPAAPAETWNIEELRLEP